VSDAARSPCEVSGVPRVNVPSVPPVLGLRLFLQLHTVHCAVAYVLLVPMSFEFELQEPWMRFSVLIISITLERQARTCRAQT
jgi:hypothetical protein